MKRTVLHVSVRLERGGAAGVARTLSTEMVPLGYQGRLAYGYGPRAGDSPDEASTSAIRITSRPRALANAGVHSVFGTELVDSDRGRSARLTESAAASDLIHLHAIHSYMGPPQRVVQRLAASGAPLIWTLHDYWLLTGRCALPGRCSRWAGGCGSCPDLRAYPPAMLDHTVSGAQRKRNWVSNLKGITFVSPSSELADSFATVYPHHRLERIPNGVDRVFASPVASIAPAAARRGYAIVADDLSDAKKVPPAAVAGLIAAGVDLRLIGRESPYGGPHVTNVGSVTDRSEVARLIGQCKGLLFLSEVDIFSMVLLEALCVGTPVLALPSANAAEALGSVGGRPLADAGAVISAVKADRNWAGQHSAAGPGASFGGSAAIDDHEGLAVAARAQYSTDVMVEAYAKLYDRILAEPRQLQRVG